MNREEKIDISLADDKSWDSFFSSSPIPVPFSSSAFRNSAAAVSELKHDTLIATISGTAAIGIHIYYRLNGGRKFCRHPYLTPYNTLIRSADFSKLSEGAQSRVLSALAAFIKKSYIYPYFLADPLFNDLRNFQWENFKVSAAYTYLVDPANVRPDSDIVRRARKCGEEGFYLKEGNDPDSFHHLLRSTAQRQHIKAVMSLEQVKELFASCRSYLYTLTSFDASGHPHACWVQMRGGTWMYNWNAASDAALLSKGGTPFLVMGMLERLRQLNVQWDLCGADHPSVSKFKATIGGKLTPYFKCDYSSYSLLQKIRFRLQ
jgi:hypothetical protein